MQKLHSTYRYFCQVACVVRVPSEVIKQRSQAQRLSSLQILKKTLALDHSERDTFLCYTVPPLGAAQGTVIQ